MTTPEVVTVAPAHDASVMDDIIEIFYAPSRVFARRGIKPKWGVALLIFGLLFALLTFVLFKNYAALYDAERARVIAEVMRKNPQVTAEQMNRGQGLRDILGPISAGIVLMISTLILSVVVWLVGKLFGSQANIAHSAVIATLSQFPRLIDPLLASIQALTMGTGSVHNVMAIPPSAARFLGDDASRTALAVAARVSIGTIWATVLIGIGLHVIGRLSKGTAAAAAVIIWLLGTGIAFATVNMFGR